MTKRGKFRECATCINRELDPFACVGCENGSNYEPEVEEEDTYEELSFEEFKQMFGLNE